ncbi:MAG: DUF11 domain-containing protein, partial [Acidobacteria bacterium]|nr:DUF11 domain-containing protein [Acidobacteriota bacterium]
MAKLNPAGSALVYSTYLGRREPTHGIAIDPSGNAYVTLEYGGFVAKIAEGAPPDLSISKSHTGNFTFGVNGVYILRVTNVGTGPTIGTITVTDTLTNGLSFVSGTGTGWTCSASGRTVTCTSPGPIAAGASSSITLTVGVAGAAVPSADNTASVSTSGEQNLSNNTATDPTTVEWGTVIDLSITKTHTGSFQVGGPVGTYLVTVTNVGSKPTTHPATITDTLPTGLSFVVRTFTTLSCSASGQIVTCPLSTGLTPGTTATFAITVEASAAAFPSVVNTVTVSTEGDTNSANNTASDLTPVGGLRIVASAGTPQFAAAETAFATPLAATVQNAYGNAIPGATVTFAAPSSGASGTFANGTTTTTAVTNSTGIATASTFTANAIPGTYTVTATTSSVTSAATFTLTNGGVLSVVDQEASAGASVNMPVTLSDGTG